MRNGFSVTFETFTPESVENGEADDRGFIVEPGSSLRDCIPSICYGFSDPRMCAKPEPDCWPDVPRALTWGQYYSTSEGDSTDESRTLHFPKNITSASARRVARLFRVIVR